MIIGTNISKSFTGSPIFENVDFKLGNRRKVALVGKNGCGKSTLLKIIAGELSSDTGSIKTENESIGYISQEFNFPSEKELVGEYLEKLLDNSWDFYRVEKLVADLEFHNFDPYQEIGVLSEGQKMKLKVLEILLGDPAFLLIDEPTNHLDIEGIMWFEKYIKNLNKSVLMVSHDRQFLNNTVDEIWEIDNKKLFRFVGDYDYYKEEKLKLIDKWDEEYVRFVKRKAQLETLIESARKIRDGKKRGSAVSSAKKRMEREIIGAKKEKYVDKKMREINFDTGITHSKLMVRFDSVTKAFAEIKVFDNLTFEIRGGEKVWLFGPNGAGKSTIVNLIKGDDIPTNGDIRVGENLKIGYFAQKQTHLDYAKNLLELFIEDTGCYYGDAFAKLRKFMFEREDLQKSVGDLSPGQRARYAFAIFAAKDYDMLILDEPDNHLDIDTKEVLENSLREYKGTLLLVSHDRFFVERVGVAKILNLREGVLSEY